MGQAGMQKVDVVISALSRPANLSVDKGLVKDPEGGWARTTNVCLDSDIMISRKKRGGGEEGRRAKKSCPCMEPTAKLSSPCLEKFLYVETIGSLHSPSDS